MKNLNFKISLLFLLLIFSNTNAQDSYTTIKGKKANYTIDIPNNYSTKEATGSNVDIKYVNSVGTSIVVVAARAPNNASEGDIEQMMNISDEKWKDMLESRGLENIHIIKRGIIKINGVKSHFSYYKDSELYFHTIMQIRNGKIVTLTITCLYESKGLNFAMINRVVNSLK